jgi:hypothetical protein
MNRLPGQVYEGRNGIRIGTIAISMKLNASGHIPWKWKRHKEDFRQAPQEHSFLGA